MGWSIKKWNKMVSVTHECNGEQSLPIERPIPGLMTSYWGQSDDILTSFDKFESIFGVLKCGLIQCDWFDLINNSVNVGFSSIRISLCPSKCLFGYMITYWRHNYVFLDYLVQCKFVV